MLRRAGRSWRTVVSPSLRPATLTKQPTQWCECVPTCRETASPLFILPPLQHTSCHVSRRAQAAEETDQGPDSDPLSSPLECLLHPLTILPCVAPTQHATPYPRPYLNWFSMSGIPQSSAPHCGQRVRVGVCSASWCASEPQKAPGIAAPTPSRQAAGCHMSVVHCCLNSCSWADRARIVSFVVYLSVAARAQVLRIWCCSALPLTPGNLGVNLGGANSP
mmetsp:Transcript_28044/g.47571  ORF Transcript_28044/g.47571 Transcript_28044/m.47571 type:complete len:220 (-) Transcript_28044:669-1328(-)